MVLHNDQIPLCIIVFTCMHVHVHTAPALAPIGLSVISQTSSSLTLAWMAPPLERQNGLITGYSVNVTNTDTGVSVLLSSTRNSITVTQLSPYTSYLCSVAAQTIVGQGPYTSPITVTTGEDGENKFTSSTIINHTSMLFLIAPIGSPVSLEVVSSSSTSVMLSWSPPPEVQLNGVLRHYVLIVQELDSGRNVTLTSTDSLIILSDLHPFYSYVIAVCPVTVDTGPCANFEPIQLPQDGKLCFILQTEFTLTSLHSSKWCSCGHCFLVTNLYQCTVVLEPSSS